MTDENVTHIKPERIQKLGPKEKYVFSFVQNGAIYKSLSMPFFFYFTFLPSFFGNPHFWSLRDMLLSYSPQEACPVRRRMHIFFPADHSCLNSINIHLYIYL